MRISLVVSAQPTRFEAARFEVDFEANVTRLARLGYEGVELAVRDPGLLDVRTIKRVLDAHHLRVPAIGTGLAFVEEGLSFTDPDPRVRESAISRIEKHIALAQEFKAIVIIGLIRGKVKAKVSLERTRAWLVDVLRTVARRAKDSGVRLALEPINRFEADLVNTVAEAHMLIDEGRMDNVGILFDTFHANIEESHIGESLRACGARLFHVHVADSNRCAPGTGHIDFRQIISTLREMQYTSWISAEILPRPDPSSAAEQTLRTLQALLR